MPDLVLATNNQHKIAEISPILLANNISFATQNQFFQDEVEEDGKSFLENALKKARFTSLKTGFPALADDSGLMVDVLDGKPGIYSARFVNSGNNKASDEENIYHLLDELKNYPQSKQRLATYITVMVYVKNPNDEAPLIGVGKLTGDILQSPRNKGIGYDSVFWIPNLFKTMAEVSLRQKLQISHRSKALTQIIRELKND